MTKRLLGCLVAAIVVVGLILVFTKSYNGYSATVMVKDAEGLENGSNVQLNGVTVGKVSKLTVNSQGVAVVGVHLNQAASPLGAGARATVEIDGFFGERELDLTRGDYQHHPEKSGYVIPVADSGDSTRLDDVVDTLDPDAQGALQTFLDEQGTALVGRGHSLSQVLSELPHSLPQLTSLLSQLSQNQQALGDLVDRSDRVVAQVAAQRSHLGDMVNSANGALSALASRRPQLGSTVQTAPGTLAQARSTLATLQGAAIPLAPAADGLRATAPSLTAALHKIPAFTAAAVPTLNEVATVAPALQTLADEATPVVRAIVPLAGRLTSYTRQALVPTASLLANQGGLANTFGVMEGWARSTQGYDGASHIFRFGASLNGNSFDELLDELNLAKDIQNNGNTGSSPAATSPASAPASSAPSTSPGKSLLPPAVGNLGGALGKTLSGALGAVNKTADGALQNAGGAVSGATQNAGSKLSGLLGYLLKK